MLAGVDATDDGVEAAGRAVDDAEWRVKAMLGGLARGDVGGVLVAMDSFA